MADVFDKAKRSEVMAAIRSTANKDTELKLIAILRAHRISGWRRRYRLPGNPDFIFLRERVAIFVDGCFWHGCPVHGRNPSSNRAYWIPKLRRNSERDREVSKFLRRAGWHVLRIWEHELSAVDRVAARINLFLVSKTQARLRRPTGETGQQKK